MGEDVLPSRTPGLPFKMCASEDSDPRPDSYSLKNPLLAALPCSLPPPCSELGGWWASSSGIWVPWPCWSPQSTELCRLLRLTGAPAGARAVGILNPSERGPPGATVYTGTPNVLCWARTLSSDLVSLEWGWGLLLPTGELFSPRTVPLKG